MVSTTELFAGRFRLGPLLGQGGMSDVFRAEDEQTGGPVALKIVRSGDPELARRLAQEVRVHQRIAHEGLIKLLDTGVADGQAYIVMELVEGATLAASLRAAPLGARLTAKLGGILGSALAYVHAEGIVHRDVKPSNILLGADGRALLGDFGIARLLDGSTFTVDGTTMGTVAYMAPEQLEDHQVGAPADIWSLGLVLLECLTGRRTYEGTSSEIIARRLAGPVPLPADLPAPWRLLLSGMLDHRPDQRLTGEQVAALVGSPVFAEPWTPSPATEAGMASATAAMDLTALRSAGATATEAVGGGTAVVPPEAASSGATVVGGPPVVGPPRHRRSDGWSWLVALLVVLAALGGGLAYALSSGSPSGSNPPPHRTGSTTTSSTTTTSTSSTTTTTVPSAPTALAALVRDIASGVDTGSVSPNVGQNLGADAQRAVTAEATGQPDQAVSALQQAATTIATQEQSGALLPGEAAVLQSDLSALAATLGLSAASEAPTTTAPTAPTPGPGKHKKGPEG
jgi:serine/threonine protein kinase